MQTKKQDIQDLMKRDFRNLIPNIIRIFKILPLKAMSWTLRMIIMVLQAITLLYLFASFIVGFYVLWQDFLWKISDKIFLIIGLLLVILMFIAIYHENLERRIKKKNKKK